jgi:hypothetical protein
MLAHQPSGLWALAKVMDVEQSHAEMFDACWALHQPTCAHWHMGGAAHAGDCIRVLGD